MFYFPLDIFCRYVLERASHTLGKSTAGFSLLLVLISLRRSRRGTRECARRSARCGQMPSSQATNESRDPSSLPQSLGGRSGSRAGPKPRSHAGSSWRQSATSRVHRCRCSQLLPRACTPASRRCSRRGRGSQSPCQSVRC